MSKRFHLIKKKEHGATLVELVMTIVIISVAIAGVVGAFSLIAGRSADPLNQTRAVSLAQRYMDEILARKFDENSPVGGGKVPDCFVNGSESGETRSSWDDVDDYNEIDNKIPSDYWDSADPESGYEQFKVSVTVVCDDSLSVDPTPKRVEITITDPSQNNYVFSAYRGNF